MKFLQKWAIKMNVFRVLKLAWYLYQLEMVADGDVGILWRPGLNKWEIGFEGDLYHNWVQGSSLVLTLDYFLKRKIKKN